MSTIQTTRRKAPPVSAHASPKKPTGSKPASAQPDSKPLLRGWFHLGAVPVVLIAGLALVATGPTLAGRITAAVFAFTSLLLFGTSAVYHRGNWDPTVTGVLRRIDHSNIFLIIAGTYTPLAVMLLPKNTAILALSVVWAGAIGGLLMRVLWLSAPRWLYVPMYVGLGWVAIAFTDSFYESGGPAVVSLIVAGGIAYTAGAVIYGTKWPDPSPKYFGFHEIFHSLTLVGFVCTFIAASIAIYNA